MTMNWAVFALSVSAVLVAVWLWLVVRRRWRWTGLYASLGCLIAACFNSAAPVRGLVDPGYVGFQFGLVGSGKGVGVTLVAGAIFLATAASAMIAASRSAGPKLWLVAATCAAMFVIIGVPTLQQAFTDPSASSIQFGEYLTIPGIMATMVAVLLLTLPFAVGAVWAAIGAGNRID
jgi:hypothetical protein